MAKLDTDYGTFKDLISVARVYTVPLYQRRYSWKARQQVAELWADVVRLYGQRLNNGDVEATHFIGSLVVGETEGRALGPGACNVIDGQQRLTTLSLLVAALRDALVDDEADRREITENYLTFPKKAGQAAQLRLRLSQSDVAVYEAIVLGDATPDRRSMVFQSYYFLINQLSEGFRGDDDPDDQNVDEQDEQLESPDAADHASEDTTSPDSDREPVDLPETSESVEWHWPTLLQVISGDLELVSISGVPAERAYQIFATLNHGGLRLTQVDLIRNAVFMKLPTRNQQAYKKVWQPLERDLGDRGLARYLHAWVVRRGHNVPQKDTYASVLHELKISGPAEDDAYSLLADLSEHSLDYRLISEPQGYQPSKTFKELGVSEAIIRELIFLNRWGSVPAQPLLLDIMTRHLAKGFSTKVALSAFRRLESLMVRRFICAIPPNDLRSTLARLMQQLRQTSDPDFLGALTEALFETSRRWPSDDDVEEALTTRGLYRGGNRQQTFLVLKRIAEELEGKECPHVELGSTSTRYSIEHVLPETTAGTTWLKDLELWGDPDAQVTWNNRRHTIGNLTLTAYNSELSNGSFADKRQWFEKKLRLQLSSQILDADVWTRKEIEARSQRLAAVAIKIWPRP